MPKKIPKQYGESPIAKSISKKPPLKPRWDTNTHGMDDQGEIPYPYDNADCENEQSCYAEEDAISLAPETEVPVGNFTISAGNNIDPSSYQGLPNSHKKIKERPVMGDTMTAQPALPEDIDIFKTHAVIERVSEKLHVTAVAIDKKKGNNNIESIKSYGDSLGGYAYDTGTDSYLVSCCSYTSLGTIPLVLRLTVPGHSGKIIIPLPEALIHRYMSPQQRRLMRAFMEKNQGCDIQFIQCLSRT